MRRYALSLAAEGDLRSIWRYTFDTWGEGQANKYLSLIEACCSEIAAGRARSKVLPKLPENVRIHRCEHHYIVWLDEERPIIIAVLHERMDFIAQLKDRF